MSVLASPASRPGQCAHVSTLGEALRSVHPRRVPDGVGAILKAARRLCLSVAKESQSAVEEV
jgi:hypothetical protein